MSAFDKVFGGGNKGPQVIEGGVTHEPSTAPQTMQEKMLANLLKQLIPGFDFSQIAKMGDDVQTVVTFFREATIRIENNQAEILRRLDQIGQDQIAHEKAVIDKLDFICANVSKEQANGG